MQSAIVAVNVVVAAPGGVPVAVRRGTRAARGPFDPVAGAYKIDAIDLTVFPGQAVEYKRLVEGATMIFTHVSGIDL